MRDILPNIRILLVHGSLGGNEGDHTAGTNLVKSFCKEIIVNQEIVTVISFIWHFVCAERHIADGHIKEVFSVSGFKTSDCNIRFGIKQCCNPAGHAVQFHTVQVTVLHAFRQHSKEIAYAAGRFQNVSGTEPHLFQRLVHRANHSWRSIVSVQRRRACHVVLFRSEQLFQLYVLIAPVLVIFIKSLGNPAPANIPGKDFLFLSGCSALFSFNGFQRPDCSNVIAIFGFLPAFTQMIICDMKVLCTDRDPGLSFRYRFLCLRPEIGTINIIPDIQAKQALKHFLAFGAKHRVSLGWITQADIKESNVLYYKSLITKINGITGMEIIGENGRFRFTRCQIHHNFPHSRDTIMFGNPAFTRAKGRNPCFYRLFGLFHSGFLNISLYLLDKRIVFQRFRIDYFTVNDAAFSKIFPDSNRIYIIQTILFFLGVKLVIPNQSVQCVCGICPWNLPLNIIHHDRERRQIAAVFFTQPFGNLLGSMPFLHKAGHGMLAFNTPVPFPESAFNIHLGNNPICGTISLVQGFRLNRRIMHPGLWERHFSAKEIFLQF